MGSIRERGWSVLFSLSVGILMLAVLLLRADPMPLWVLVLYPGAGMLLGLAASRTSPSVEQMAWLESGTIAAAAIVLLAALVNMMLADMLLRQFTTGEMLSGTPGQQALFYAAPCTAVLLWWALQRRLGRLRLGSSGEVEMLGVPAE